MLKDEVDKATWESHLYTWEHLQSESMWADFDARRDVEAKLRKEAEGILRRYNTRKQDEKTVDRKKTEDKIASKKDSTRCEVHIVDVKIKHIQKFNYPV